MPHELLVEVTRNDIVESQHFGSAVVCDAQGGVVEAWGDIEGLVFPRSAIKPIFAINLIESGAAEHYQLGDAELSLACSSHYGEETHQGLVISWLKRIGLTEACLVCGAELPLNRKSEHKLISSGRSAGRSHHNCSGKHTGLLTVAQHLGMPIENYHFLEHPLQQLLLKTMSEMSGVDIGKEPMGTDGCGLPAFTMSLRQLGYATARFANPVNLPKERVEAIHRLQKAMRQEPHYISGRGTIATDLIEVTKGRVLAKTGAEGMFIAMLPEQGLGIALKIADGNHRGCSVAILAILNHLNVLSEEENKQLEAYARPTLLNSRGLEVGHIRPAASWLP